MQSLAQGTRPVIVLRCCNLSAFHVSAYSAHERCGCIEPRICATTPSSFIVIASPYLSNSAVVVDVLLDISTSAPYLSKGVEQQPATVLPLADASVKAAFATTAIVDALERMLPNATTPNVIRSLSAVIRNLTEGAVASVVNAPSLLFSFFRVTRSATSSTVVCCLRAICSFTSDLVLFIPSSSQSVRDEVELMFVRDAIDSIFRLSDHVATPNAVSWLSRAICNMAKVTLRRNLLAPKKFLAQKTTTIDGVVTKFAVARLSTYATTPDAVRWLSTAISNIISGANTSVTATFATPAVAEAAVRMSYHATTPDAVLCLSTAMSNIISGALPSVKAAFATSAVVEAVARMSHNATTSKVVCSLSEAIACTTEGADASVKTMFATTSIVET
ncbi:Hypothetical protein, putative, partial [Bodo saltans]